MRRDTDLSPFSVHLHAAGLDYGGTPLFHDLSLDLPAGSWTCLLGPSGVGKTTFLKLVAGLVEPWAGSRIEASDGRPLADRIAYMGQQDLLMPWLTVRDNVTVGSRLRRETLDVERAMRLLDRVGVADKADTRPAALSGGQRQRVALARTLYEDRPLLLMDEPFSALDAVTRHAVQELATELLHGRTVLFVTHDPVEALRLGDRLFVLAGRPATLGAALEPPGRPPRDTTQPDLAALQSDLMARLRAAYAAAAG